MFHESPSLVSDIEDFDEDKYTPDYVDEGGAENDATQFFEGGEEYEEFDEDELF